MTRYEESAGSEITRADHLFHVTLKYTRTVDVIKNTLQRLINALDFAIIDFLESSKVKNIPKVFKKRCDLILEKNKKDKKIKEIVRFYMKLRNLNKAEYKAKDEYRKGVSLVTPIGIVDIPELKEFFEKTKDYVRYLQK